MKRLSITQLIILNRMTIEENGGQFVPPHNLLHGEHLEYIVEAVDAEMFGVALYPTVADKAALYMFNIISNHVFSDGNKRTGLTAALTFLLINGYELRPNLENIEFDIIPVILGNNYDDDLEAFTLAMASGNISLKECRAWFEKNIVPIVQSILPSQQEPV